MPRRALLLLAILVGARLVAQDVIVGELQWLTNPAPADPPPKRGSRPHVAYPNEMRPPEVIGYAIAAQSPTGGPAGMPAVMFAGTHEPFTRAVKQEIRGGGDLVFENKHPPPNAAVWQAFIFNPKSAGVKLRDATPRLLSIVPIFTRTRLGGADNSTGWVKISVDATGAVTAAEPEPAVPPPVRDLVIEAVRQWKFAPARRNGTPVSAELTVPVVAQGRFFSGATDPAVVLPHPLETSGSLPYPPGLLSHNLRGEVLVEFEVETDGRLVNPRIVRSTHPAFEAIAMERLRALKFAPGTRDGKPEKMKSRYGFTFDPAGGRDATRIAVSQMDKLPEEIRFDVAPRVRNIILPVYPYALLRGKVSGHAQATLTLDARGRVVHAEIVEATHPDFGHALLAAVWRFEFEPALKAGRPTPTMVTQRQDFRPYGFDQMPAPGEIGMLAREVNRPQDIVGSDKLDAPLQSLSRVAPLAPGGRGRAVVEFLVDEKGQARLPRVVEATTPELGYAAVQAAAAWRFAPPRAGGKAAVVRVQAPFNFGD